MGGRGSPRLSQGCRQTGASESKQARKRDPFRYLWAHNGQKPHIVQCWGKAQMAGGLGLNGLVLPEITTGTGIKLGSGLVPAPWAAQGPPP